jgi:hypothetical protein
MVALRFSISASQAAIYRPLFEPARQASAAYLKFLHHKRRILFRNFK